MRYDPDAAGVRQGLPAWIAGNAKSLPSAVYIRAAPDRSDAMEIDPGSPAPETMSLPGPRMPGRKRMPTFCVPDVITCKLPVAIPRAIRINPHSRVRLTRAAWYRIGAIFPSNGEWTSSSGSRKASDRNRYASFPIFARLSEANALGLIYPAILLGILLCLWYDFIARYDAAAKKLYRLFKNPPPEPVIKPAPDNLRLHEWYGRMEAEAGKSGFKKLGDLYVEKSVNGVADGHVVRVMVDDGNHTILAFSRPDTGAKSVEQIEMENWRADGSFFYSCNNPLVYQLKSPEKIVVNKVSGGNLRDFIASHASFTAGYEDRRFMVYDRIEKVIEGIEIQNAMRNAVLKTKEFPIDEEEANLLGNNLYRRANRRIYARLRELRNFEEDAKRV